MISYISKVPSEERCADSSKSVGELNFRLRTWAKWILPFKGSGSYPADHFQICTAGSRSRRSRRCAGLSTISIMEDVLLVDDDTRKSEYTPGRIIRVNRHIDIVFVADRHDLLRKYFRLSNNFSSLMSSYMAKRS